MVRVTKTDHGPLCQITRRPSKARIILNLIKGRGKALDEVVGNIKHVLLPG
jgi:hypothetical protein